MAIYRTGTASLAANGVVIGVGTKWQDKLSLIRVGATIMFPTVVGAIGTISSIVSDTELRVMTTNGAVAPAGSQYVILLHDSITVDGLAQDVAETLRYYQGRETEISDALNFFRTFDWEAFKAMVDRVAENTAETEASKNAAKVSEDNAKASELAANTSETNASNSASAALESQNKAKGSEDAAKSSETNAKESESNAANSEVAALSSQNAAKASEDKSKASETNAANSAAEALASNDAAKTSETNASNSAAAALASQNAAKTSETNAKASETNAKTSEENAKQSEINAEQWAQNVNADNLLTKSGNLEGVADVAAARTNLGLGTVATLNTVPVANGGTGATTVAAARTNLGLGTVATLNTVPVANGGTGATTVAAARTNLGLGTTQAVSFGSMVLSNAVKGAYASGFAAVVAGGSFGAQYSNPTAIAVDSTSVEGYITLMRVTVPGVGNPGGMDCFMYANGASLLRLNTGGATYVFNSNGTATAASWTSTSDERIKEDITRIENPLEKMKRIKGVSWRLLTNGRIGHGFIAQDVEQDFPSAVIPLQDMQLSDGSIVKNVKSVDTYGVAAALHHEAILALMAKIEELEEEIRILKS